MATCSLPTSVVLAAWLAGPNGFDHTLPPTPCTSFQSERWDGDGDGDGDDGDGGGVGAWGMGDVGWGMGMGIGWACPPFH